MADEIISWVEYLTDDELDTAIRAARHVKDEDLIVLLIDEQEARDEKDEQLKLF